MGTFAQMAPDSEEGRNAWRKDKLAREKTYKADQVRTLNARRNSPATEEKKNIISNCYYFDLNAFSYNKNPCGPIREFWIFFLNGKIHNGV